MDRFFAEISAAVPFFWIALRDLHVDATSATNPPPVKILGSRGGEWIRTISAFHSFEIRGVPVRSQTGEVRIGLVVLGLIRV